MSKIYGTQLHYVWRWLQQRWKMISVQQSLFRNKFKSSKNQEQEQDQEQNH